MKLFPQTLFLAHMATFLAATNFLLQEQVWWIRTWREHYEKRCDLHGNKAWG